MLTIFTILDVVIRNLGAYFVNGPLLISTGVVHNIKYGTKADARENSASSIFSIGGVPNNSVMSGNITPADVNPSDGAMNQNVQQRDDGTIRSQSASTNSAISLILEQASIKTTNIKPVTSSVITTSYIFDLVHNSTTTIIEPMTHRISEISYALMAGKTVSITQAKSLPATNDARVNRSDKTTRQSDSNARTVIGPLVYVEFVVDQVSDNSQNFSLTRKNSNSLRIEFTIQHPAYKKVQLIFDICSCKT